MHKAPVSGKFVYPAHRDREGRGHSLAHHPASGILLATATRGGYSESVREYTTCRSCNRNIAADFRFCPYCGTERIRDYQFRQFLDQSFSDMDGPSQSYSLQWLARLEERLLTLETDLDSFLSLSTGQRR